MIDPNYERYVKKKKDEKKESEKKKQDEQKELEKKPSDYYEMKKSAEQFKTRGNQIRENIQKDKVLSKIVNSKMGNKILENYLQDKREKEFN